MRRLWNWEALLTVLLVASVTVNGTLALKLSAMRRSANRVFNEGQLVIGSKAPPLPLVDQDGRPVVIEPGVMGRSIVLYIFDPSCGWCSRNQASIAALVHSVESNYQFVGLSLSPVRLTEFVSSAHMGLPAVYVATAAAMRAYKLGGTPATIVISPQGYVDAVWKGAYVGPLHAEIEKYFGVSVPEAASQEPAS